MTTDEIVAALDEQIALLQRGRSLLTGHILPLKRGNAPTPQAKRTISAETRARMAAAQQKRRAKAKQGK